MAAHRRELVFFAGDAKLGLAISYPSLVLHALLPENGAENRASVYAQIEAATLQTVTGEQVCLVSPGEEASVFEIYMAPKDPLEVEDLYYAICECSALHPSGSPLQDGDDAESDEECQEGQGDEDDEEEKEGKDREDGEGELEEQNAKKTRVGEEPIPDK